jgi:hypothetical protein
MGALVYTAIFGGHDDLKQPVRQTEDCEYICFTDSRMPSRIGVWRVIHVKTDPQLYSRLQAKRFKVLSHELFPGGRLAFRYAPFSIRRRFDLAIWVDASLQIKSETFVSDMRAALGQRDWAMFAHPDRDCIYQEAAVAITQVKYDDFPILPQAEAYRSVIPPHGGLYACTLIVRREPESEEVKRANELWWRENTQWTPHDQISLPYILRKGGIAGPAPIPGNLWSNKWFDMAEHNRET